MALRNDSKRRIRGRIPRRVPGNHSERAPRHDGGLRGHAGRGSGGHPRIQRTGWTHHADHPHGAPEPGGPGRGHQLRYGRRHAGIDGPPRTSRCLPAMSSLIGSARATAWLAVATATATLLLLASLHLLSPEFAPSWRMVSEYANGHYGWVLSLMFAAWGLSSWALALAIGSQLRTISGRIGLVSAVPSRGRAHARCFCGPPTSPG